MAIEINAGDTFDVSCPSGENPILSIGDTLPSEKEILVKVLKIKKEIVTLGPFKTGTLNFSLPCTSSNIPIQATIKELNPQVAHKRYTSLKAEKIDYPASFFVFCLLIILSLIGTFLYLRHKKKNLQPKVEKKTSKINPRSELEKHLLHCETNVKTPDVKHLHDTYKLLRNFLEKENNLSTRSLTTIEFIGTLRAMGLKQNKNHNLLSQLEYVLKTSDDVRFAKRSMNPQMWQDYLSKTKAIFLAFPKKDELPKNTNQEKKR